MKARLPNTALSITILVWALNFVAIKIVYESINQPTLMLVRVGLMWMSLALYCIYKRVPITVDKEDRWKAWSFGLLNMGIYMYFFLAGVGKTSAAEGAIVLATAPLMTAILSAIRGHDKLTRQLIFGLVLALFGVGLFVFHPGVPNSNRHLVGDAMVLFAALLWALCAQLSRDLVRKYSPIRAFTASTVGAFPALLIYGFSSTVHTNWLGISRVGWTSLLFMSFVSGAVGFTLFYVGISQIGPSRAVRYQYFTPVLTSIFAAILLHDPIGWAQLVGMIALIGGLMLASSNEDRKCTEITGAIPSLE